VKATSSRGSITTWGYRAGNRDGLGHRRVGEGCSEGEAPERKRFTLCLQKVDTSMVDSRRGNTAPESKELCSQGIFHKDTRERPSAKFGTSVPSGSGQVGTQACLGTELVRVSREEPVKASARDHAARFGRQQGLHRDT
jgi:hypothetical protein